ncbi:deubiquitinase OTUD6B-like [Teleopsis dalmanni]|uniref:deubiquitinase OTUD6B n=1 Tax=Teleopsis dalmanni TaxID=139649 RepID=UPI0018CF2D7A|nr:deubiquitinase OTUD6B [Teleopsis dalmanni]XP_037938536.1 deubiquitinase OTUD6B-like [Teleopsis dalmanni]
MTTTTESLVNKLQEISIDELAARHRREKKELQAKIQEMKKCAKNDKKKRKELLEEITRLENHLIQRQQQELMLSQQILQEQNQILLLNENHNTEELVDNKENAEDEEKPERISKAQKRRNKKANEARQREEDILAASKDAKNEPKAVEQRKLVAKLKEMDLMIFEVPSDGDCLYNAIRHQLGLHDLHGFTVDELREETAKYIRENKDTLICFMTDPHTGNLLDDEQFEHYCKSVQSTPAWGGHIELKALSSVLEIPIEVIQAEGSNTVQGNEFKGPKLTITYHRHMYSLGEHYNSTVALLLEEHTDDE